MPGKLRSEVSGEKTMARKPLNRETLPSSPTKRPSQRRLLLIVGVLLFLVVERDEHLSGPHAVAEIGQQAAHPSFGLRRNRDLVHGGERPDDVHGPADRVLTNCLDAYRLRGGFGAARLSRFGPGTGG